jgi:hypothetical protein
MCALPCASARTMTHCFATMLTQGEDDRGLGGRAVDGDGSWVTTGVGVLADARGGCGIAASGEDTGVDGTGSETSERTTFPVASVVSRGLTVSAGAVAVTRATVSAGAALCFD